MPHRWMENRSFLHQADACPRLVPPPCSLGKFWEGICAGAAFAAGAGPDTGATSTGSVRICLTLDFLAWCCRAGWEAHTCARLTQGTLLKRQPQFVSCLLCENHSHVHTQNGSQEDCPAPASTPQPLAGWRTHMVPSLPSCSSAAGKAVEVPGTCGRGHEGTAALHPCAATPAPGQHCQKPHSRTGQERCSLILCPVKDTGQ